jgi:hypothetical protein
LKTSFPLETQKLEIKEGKPVCELYFATDCNLTKGNLDIPTPAPWCYLEFKPQLEI